MRGRMGGMRFRKLRIAWSVFWGVPCVMLIVLWVRSYWRQDRAGFLLNPTRMFAVDSNRGTIEFQTYGPKQDNWGTFTKSVPHRDTLPSGYVYNAGRRSWRWETDVYSRRWFWTIPDWFFVFVAGAFSVLPWTGWIRWHFSLRTLLIATTIIAVVLGLIVWLR